MENPDIQKSMGNRRRTNTNKTEITTQKTKMMRQKTDPTKNIWCEPMCSWMVGSSLFLSAVLLNVKSGKCLVGERGKIHIICKEP